MTQSRGPIAPRHLWTDAQLELLRSEFEHTSTAELAQRLGFESATVSRKAKVLGLRKTAEHRARMLEAVSSNLREGGKNFRFAKGRATWNKGKNYMPGGRSIATRFQPGRATHNYQPIGTEKVREGYLMRKMTDDPSVLPRYRWSYVHRLVWVAAHGPIPPGHVVVFKAGRHSTDRAQITLDALELLTRAQLMQRNSLHTIMPPELTHLVQLRGAITRQINRRTKAREKQD